MKKFAKFLLLFTLSAQLTLFGTGIAFADTYSLDLNEAMDMAIDNSQDIKNIESQMITLNDTVRSGLQSRNQLVLMMDSYDDFKDMWYEDDADKDYDHLKDMTTEELNAELGYRTNIIDNFESDLEVLEALGRGDTSVVPSGMTASEYKADVVESLEDADKVKRTGKELEFMKYLLIFGNDEPDLTDEELYENYEKNALLLEIQTKAAVEKTLNNIDLIKGNMKNAVIQLYIQSYDLDMAIELSEQEVSLLEKVNDNMASLYEQGMLSRIDYEINGLELEQKRLELKKYDYQKEQLISSFKNVLGIDPEETLLLSSMNNENNILDTVPLSKEIEMAMAANVELKGLELDLEVKQANYDLYMKASGREFGDEYNTLTDDLEYYNNQVRDKKSEIEASVRYGYADILSKMQALNNQKKTHENATVSYTNAKASYDQGLITMTELNQAELVYHAAWKGLFQAQRALEKGILKYDVLVNNGILYN